MEDEEVHSLAVDTFVGFFGNVPGGYGGWVGNMDSYF